MYNPNEVALGLLNAHQNHLSFSTAVPHNVLREAFKIASKYAKNNPVMYVLDFTQAKIIKTTQAEYDLSLAEKSCFSKPYPECKDVINRYFTILKNNIRIILKPESAHTIH